ncbi:restriction endonuclease subunit S [Sphingobacterium hotanense]|uniref:Restriction endonuclease subunit S n=1 Tax=Sphingobacterium hotanense TaxID=649196 RepID=A0ABT7NSF7_9SPHI|nr:restriction endonuclease subunit S [Sphingobacterium hotanense]MDM1050147.1 restriction endonuclease subunit S [Sphingobacterium hotanense]
MREGWKEVVLGEVCDVINGFAFKSKDFVKEGIPLVKIKELKDNRLNISDCDYLPKYFVVDQKYHINKGDVVIALTGSHITLPSSAVGRVAKSYLEETLLLNQRVGKFKVFEDKCDLDYLYFNLTSEYFFNSVGLLAKGAANQANISAGDVKSIKINLPPLETQKKIASILSGYDDLIENNLKRIKLLEEMAQQTYEEWFVRMRFPGHESATINSETGLPEGWEKVKLGDVLTLNYGKALKQENRIAGNYNVYGSSGVVGTHNNFLVEGPSLIVGRKGNVGSVYYEPNPFYPIDTVYYVTSEYSLFYLYYTIKSLSFINNDAAVPGLNRDAAYFKEINLPNIDLINEFQDLCSSNYQIIFNLQNQNQRLREARDILLPRLMMGMIEV